MMHNAKFAIVDPNVLAAIGLKQMLCSIMPMMDIDIFTSFGDMAGSEDTYVHYFVASRIYFEHTAFFRAHPHRSIVLVAGDMHINGVVTINVCQSEQDIAKTVFRMMQHGHGDGHKAPTPEIEDRSSELLSPREIEVAVQLARGLINKEIADRLNISITTVISHRKSIMDKLHARSLADITIYCVLNGLTDITELNQ